MNKNELKVFIKEVVLEDLKKSKILEEEYFELNELKIDEFSTHKYEEISLPKYTKSYVFEDRCGNNIVAVYIESIGEFKTGYKIKETDNLIFQPEKLDNVEDLIRPCPDDRRVNTVYKILLEEIIPKYLLNKKPNKILFNPVSSSRTRLVDIIINKIIEKYPQLVKRNNYIINK